LFEWNLVKSLERKDLNYTAFYLFVDLQNELGGIQIVYKHTEQFGFGSHIDHREDSLIFAVNVVNQQTTETFNVAVFCNLFNSAQCCINRLEFGKLLLALLQSSLDRIRLEVSFVVLEQFFFDLSSDFALFNSGLFNLFLCKFYLAASSIHHGLGFCLSARHLLDVLPYDLQTLRAVS